MPNPLLLSSLSKYFKENPKESRLLQSLVNGTYPVSLRVMDWFITHYSKSKNVLYWLDDHKSTIQETVPTVIHSGIRKFHLYYEYRAQLKSYTKLFFDPFRRHDRISFVIQPEISKGEIPETIETTVGQLNFFRWAIQNHILDYIQNHRAEIEDAMTQYQNQRKQRTIKDKPLGPDKKPPKKPMLLPSSSTAPTSPTSATTLTPSHNIRFD